MDHDQMSCLLEKKMPLMNDSEIKRGKAVEDERKGKRDAKIAELASENFGFSALDHNGMLTAHPVMAGIIRRALREAYEAGGADLARLMMDQVLGKMPEHGE